MRCGQNANKITHKGLTLTIDQWIDRLNLNTTKAAIWQRLFVYGWSVENALTDRRTGIRISKDRIDNGVESWHELMLCRGYFRKENRIRVYKQLNTWYKEFRAQDMKAA